MNLSIEMRQMPPIVAAVPLPAGMQRTRPSPASRRRWCRRR